MDFEIIIAWLVGLTVITVLFLFAFGVIKIDNFASNKKCLDVKVRDVNFVKDDEYGEYGECASETNCGNVIIKRHNIDKVVSRQCAKAGFERFENIIEMLSKEYGLTVTDADFVNFRSQLINKHCNNIPKLCTGN